MLDLLWRLDRAPLDVWLTPDVVNPPRRLFFQLLEGWSQDRAADGSYARSCVFQQVFQDVGLRDGVVIDPPHPLIPHVVGGLVAVMLPLLGGVAPFPGDALGVQHVEDPQVHGVVAQILRRVVVVKHHQLVHRAGLVCHSHQSHGQGGAVATAGGDGAENLMHFPTGRTGCCSGCSR